MGQVRRSLQAPVTKTRLQIMKTCDCVIGLSSIPAPVLQRCSRKSQTRGSHLLSFFVGRTRLRFSSRRNAKKAAVALSYRLRVAGWTVKLCKLHNDCRRCALSCASVLSRILHFGMPEFAPHPLTPSARAVSWVPH